MLIRKYVLQFSPVCEWTQEAHNKLTDDFCEFLISLKAVCALPPGVTVVTIEMEVEQFRRMQGTLKELAPQG